MIVTLLTCVSAHSLKNAKSVTVLTERSWNNKINKRGNDVWMVMFYGDFCPACKASIPEFVKASNQTYGLVNFGAVDATAYPSLAQKYHVTHLPTFVIFHVDGHTIFSNGRTADRFLSGVSPYAKGCLSEFNMEWAQAGTKSAILFTNNDDPPFKWKVYSCRAKGIKVGHSSDPQARLAYGSAISPAAFLINKTHKIHFKSASEALKNAENFFLGKYVSSVPVTFLLPFEMKQECKSPARLCVGFNSGTVTDSFKRIASEYATKSVRFFQGDDDWPIPVKPGEAFLIDPETWKYHIIKHNIKLGDVIKKALEAPSEIQWTV